MVAFLHVAAAGLSGFPGALLAFFAPRECVGWPLRCGSGFFRTLRRCSELYAHDWIGAFVTPLIYNALRNGLSQSAQKNDSTGWDHFLSTRFSVTPKYP